MDKTAFCLRGVAGWGTRLMGPGNSVATPQPHPLLLIACSRKDKLITQYPTILAFCKRKLGRVHTPMQSISLITPPVNTRLSESGHMVVTT